MPDILPASAAVEETDKLNDNKATNKVEFRMSGLSFIGLWIGVIPSWARFATRLRGFRSELG
ncbi:MAG: hypothetical protein Kow0060_18080 [Methylohalobius crimeensis]